MSSAKERFYKQSRPEFINEAPFTRVPTTTVLWWMPVTLPALHRDILPEWLDDAKMAFMQSDMSLLTASVEECLLVQPLKKRRRHRQRASVPKGITMTQFLDDATIHTDFEDILNELNFYYMGGHIVPEPERMNHRNVHSERTWTWI